MKPAVMVRSILLLTLIVAAATADEQTSAVRSFRYAAEFAANSALMAQPRQSIVFNSDSIDPVARFQLTAGAHKFCLDGGREYFTGIIVEDAFRISVPTTIDHQGCARVVVPEGIYIIRLAHLEAPPSRPGVTAVLTADLPSPPLNTPQGLPRKGYWAMGAVFTFLGQQQNFGRIRALPPLVSRIPNFPQAMVVTADSSTTMDEYSLFQLAARSPAVLGAPAGNFLDYQESPIPLDTAGVLILSAQRCPEGQPDCDNFGPSNPLLIIDLHDASRFKLVQAGTSNPSAPIYFGISGTSFSDNTVTVFDHCLSLCDDFTFQLVFRFFPDGTQMGPLFPGEVALYQQPNYQGKTAVFAGNNPNLPAYSSTAITIDKSAVSIKLGPNTAVTLYPGPNYSGTPRLIQSNTAQLPGDPDTSSIQISSLVTAMLATHSCVNCNLQGVDLSGLNLSGFALKGANFGGANLTGAHLNGASLAGADFTGATLTCTDFSGADKDHLNDLTQTTFTNAPIAPPGSCRVNFSYTSLTARTIPPALWKSVNLTGAVFTDLKGKTLSSQAQPLDLTGAMLAGASLQNAILDYSIGWPSAVVTGIVLDNASLKSCDLRKAVFDRASMQYTDFTSTQLAGASFDHAVLDHAIAIGKADFSQLVLKYTSLQYVDLTGTPLAGKNLQTVILDYAIGLAGADLTQTIFSNASLRHVNLSTAKLYGAQLNSANLDGANLSGAFLTKPPSGDGTANLSGAFLRNVNLTQGQISGADFTDASFYSTTAVGQGTCVPDPTTGFTNGCATAAGATMDNTAFGGAYLFGVDFTGAKALGVKFGGSFLVGANFANAKLLADTSGADTGFSGAFLQGTNLVGATLQNGISLANAFVDFTATGNIIALVLSGQHTTFPGYWNTPGQSVCAQMTYNNATTVPATDSTTTCPDGNHYASGCGPASPDGSNLQWKSKVDITQSASYTNNSTYTNAPSNGQICTADLRWIPIHVP